MNVDTLRQAVWNGLLDAALATRYHQRLADRYHRVHFWLRIVLVVSSFGVLSPTLLLPDSWSDHWAMTTFSVLMGVSVLSCVIADLVGQYSDKGALLQQVSVECGKLEDAWRILWLDNDDQYADTEELERRYQELLGQDPAEPAGEIPEREGLTQQCWKEALEVETHRYAA